jgi:hypothetical protein
MDYKKAVQVEKVEESVCFEIPAGIPDYEILAPISAIQSYVKDAYIKADAWSSQRPGYKKELTLNLDVVCTELRYVDIVNAILKPRNVWYTHEAIHTDNYAMFCDLASARLYEKNKRLHASSAYGIVAGCESKSLPDLPLVKDRYEGVDILVLCSESEKFVWEFVGKHAPPGIKVANADPGEHKNIVDLIALCNSAKIVMGKLSLATYVAASLGKGVLEIYPTHLPLAWLSKWSDPFYGMYVADVITEDDLPKLTKGLGFTWRKMMARLSKPPLATALANVGT